MTKSPNKLATKTSQIIKLLNRSSGASMDELVKASGWQKHSVPGFLSGTIKKKLGHDLSSGPDKHGVRRYRIPAPTVEVAK